MINGHLEQKAISDEVILDPVGSQTILAIDCKYTSEFICNETYFCLSEKHRIMS